MSIINRARLDAHSFFSQRWWTALIALTTVVYATWMMVLGFTRYPAMSTERFVDFMDYHYGILFGAARSLQLGVDPNLIRFNFGVLSAFVASLIAKMFSFNTVGDWMRLVQAFQCLFVLVAVVGAWLIGRRDIKLVILTIVAVCPLVSTTSSSVLAPNESGIRYLTFAFLPIAIFALQNLRGLTLVAAAAISSALFLLWNPETGIACTGAFSFYVFIRFYSDGGQKLWWRPFMAVAILAIISLVLTFNGLAALLGKFPQPHEMFAHLLGIAGGGYGGLKMTPDGVAVLVAIYASYLVIICCFEAAGEFLGGLTIERGALAVAAIIWFGYYAHRPLVWNLWGILFLLSFTVSPLLFDKGKMTICSKIAWIAVLAIVANIYLFEYFYKRMHVRVQFTSDTPTIQGVLIPELDAKFIEGQAQYLGSIEAKVVFFATASFAISNEAGKANQISAFDAFAETWTYASFIELMKRIRSSQTVCVLVESPQSPLLPLNADRAVFYSRVRQNLSDSFVFFGSKSGWSIYRRKDSDAKC
jgi:hypothetical protein